MKSKITLFLSLSTLILFFANYSALGQEPQKTPLEMASEQADRLQRDLKLADHQLFYIDSILQYNFQALTNEIEEMKKAGLQSRDTYFNAQKKWGQKTEEAFEKILDKEQFIRYLKISGRWKDYKKRNGIK
ncbi:hypothetical protein U5907_07350 [Bacteroidales bacterium MB20-C3-3]|jgi:hypothetical protein|nr:hypothetical protein U5907_07350 [Bacteroidales bacterium MB20-C3-3]